MRKIIKKAVAFALATATMITGLGVPAPVKAAEYDDLKEVLEKEYDQFMPVGNNALFVKQVNVAKEDEEPNAYVEELVIVDKNGDKTTVDVKTTDGKYKYKRASSINNKYVAMIREDGKYDVFMYDGTWFGDRKVEYDDLFTLNTGNFCIQVGDTAHIVDKTGKILAKDVFKMHDYVQVWSNYIFGEYILVMATDWSSASAYQTKVFDKDYKEVTSVNLNGYRVSNVKDELIVLLNEKEAFAYNSKFEKQDFAFKVENIEKEGMVLSKSEITSLSIVNSYENENGKDYICISVRYDYVGVDDPNYQEYMYVESYFELATLKEISEKDIKFTDVVKGDIYNTDLTVVENYEEDTTEIFLGDKKIADKASIAEFVNKNMQGKTFVHTSNYVGSAGDLYMEVYVSTDEGGKYCTLLLERVTGYDMSKAKIIDKEIYSWSQECGGCVVFEDSSYIINGKEYGENTDINMIYNWDYSDSKYYVLFTEADGKTKTTLYDKNHGEVLTRTDIIVTILADTYVVVADECGVDEYGWTKYKYGCVSFTKKLVSDEEVLEEVLEKLEEIEEGEKVEVKIEKDVPVAAEIFETIKGKDVEVVVELNNGMSWNINGKNIDAEEMKDINLTVDVVEDVIPVAAIEKVEIKGEKIELSLAHTGDFGFAAELKVNVKAENVGKFANRFFYNPATKQLEFQEAVKVDANGDVIFTYTHASDYVVIVSDVAYEVPKTDEKPDNTEKPVTPVTPDAGETKEPENTVKPGDMTNIGLLITMLGVGAVMVMAQKKKVIE